MRLYLLLAAVPTALLAQQTIFDVPSADVSASRDWFYQHQTVARSWSPERRWVQTNAYGYGVGAHTELDVTWFNLDPSAPRDSIASFGFKTSVPLNGREAPLPARFVVGDLVQFSGSGRHGNWAYSLLQVETPRSHTRLTAGVSTGTPLLFGRKSTSFMGGVEQDLNHRWMLQADWFSGRHDLAYFIPGLVYKFQPHWMVSAGYQLPNHKSPGYRAIVLELTRF